MKKALLIGVIVVVLAVSGIGAAFATGMGFSNGVGSLSTGQANVPQANVHSLFWILESDANPEPYITGVRLDFDQDLNQGTLIAVTLYNKWDGAWTDKLVHKHNGPGGLATLLPVYTPTTITFDAPVLAKDIYAIRVTVGEPVPFK